MVSPWYLAACGILNIDEGEDELALSVIFDMKILVVGSGGREHALVWKIAQSKKVGKIFALPGNPGMQNMAELVDIKVEEIAAIADFAEKEKIDLTVVGPEVPLSMGIVDVFVQRGLKVFGPSQKAAELESSKAFAKDMMQKYGIPTAFYKVCEDIETARAYIKENGAPIVIKADGLAAGKGVVVAMTMQEAMDAIESIMGGNEFGNAGARVVIEEYLEGEETSVLAFCDGKTIVPMVAAQDHKRVFDADKGPNTGGMGAYAPAPVADEHVIKETCEKVLYPIVAAMQAEGRPYQGCLYAGLMVTKNGVKVIEFNARFGDPETQVVLPLLDSDIVDVMMSCADGTLKKEDVKWKNGAAVCVVMASGGYPGKYATGFKIEGIETAEEINGVVVFHAGTKITGDELVTAGGRVLGVTALGSDIRHAQIRAYNAVESISFKDAHYRRDIAWRAIARNNT